MEKLLIITSLALGLAVNTANAQSNLKQSNSSFIFPAFANGIVYQKGGASVQALLDYNTVTQEMMFDQNGTKMVLDQVNNIDSVVIQNTVWVPAKIGFFEKLAPTPVSLYAQYQSKAVNAGAGTSANNKVLGNASLTKADDAPQNYDLKWPDSYQASTETIYWAKNGTDFKQVSNLSAFEKLFPGKESAIKDFVKANNIKWNNSADVAKLLRFANAK